jgi:hypothetical protein
MLPATLVFQGGGSLCLLQIHPFSSVELAHVPPKKNPCMLQAAGFSTLLLVTVE